MLKNTTVFLLMMIASLTSTEALVEESAGLRFFGQILSYAEYEPWNWRPNATLQFFFQTSSKKNALVFYQDDHGSKQQFMDLWLLNGEARFRARIGQEMEEVEQRYIKHNFADSKWHRVKIELSEKEIILSIDDDVIRPAKSIAFAKNTEPPAKNGALFVAGIPMETKWSYPTLFSEVFITSTPALFEGCVGDVRTNRSPNGRLERARLRHSAGTSTNCYGACYSGRCSNGGRCIDKIRESECDCKGTGYEGESCRKASTIVHMNAHKYGGYISQRLRDDSPHLSTEKNTLDFMFLTQAKDGVIFYMGRDKDHLLVELVNGSMRVQADFGGGPVVVQSSNHDLSDSCWHYVDINRRKTRLKVTIDRGKTGKDNGTSAASHVTLNLNNQSNVIYYGGGPPEVLHFAQAKPLSFKGFLKQFHFEEFNVLDDALGDDARRKGFSITDDDRVSRAWPSNILLKNTESECRADEGSGCNPSDDDSDSCKLSTIPTEGKASSTEPPTLTTPRRIPPKPQTPPPVRQKIQDPTPRPKGVSAWVIILIVLAAMVVVLISVFLLYRWNHRYTGSFKPAKAEEGQPQEPGAEAEQQQSARVYNQPAFFVYKPHKKPPTAQSPPVSI